MGYVLVIISFVAMGGPRATTPTIDHVDFDTEATCIAAMNDIGATLQRGHVVYTAKCHVK